MGSVEDALKDIRLVIQTVLLISFYVMAAFYIYQKKKKRCRWEVLYIATTAGLANTIGLAAGHMEPLSFHATGVSKKVPWLRMSSWMVTCPVLLIHLNNLAGVEVVNVERASILVLELNAMVLLGVTSSLTDGGGALVFFMLSWLVCFTIFVQAWTIFNEAFASLPSKAKGHLNAMMFCFYVGWAGFGILFAAGPEGWGPEEGTISAELVSIALVIVDFIAKIVFGFIGWHLRWRVLRGEDGKVLRAKREGENAGAGDKSATSMGGIRTMSREVLLCSAHDDYVSVVLRTKLAGIAMSVTVIGNAEDILAKLDKEADKFAFVIVSLPMLRMTNGEIAQHASISARSPRKILPLITYTQQITDDDFAFIRSLEVDDFIDAPFFDEDITDTVHDAMSYARQLRAQVASTTQVNLALP